MCYSNKSNVCLSKVSGVAHIFRKTATFSGFVDIGIDIGLKTVRSVCVCWKGYINENRYLNSLQNAGTGRENRGDTGAARLARVCQRCHWHGCPKPVKKLSGVFRKLARVARVCFETLLRAGMRE